MAEKVHPGSGKETSTRSAAPMSGGSAGGIPSEHPPPVQPDQHDVHEPRPTASPAPRTVTGGGPPPTTPQPAAASATATASVAIPARATVVPGSVLVTVVPPDPAGRSRHTPTTPDEPGRLPAERALSPRGAPAAG